MFGIENEDYHTLGSRQGHGDQGNQQENNLKTNHNIIDITYYSRVEFVGIVQVLRILATFRVNYS